MLCAADAHCQAAGQGTLGPHRLLVMMMPATTQLSSGSAATASAARKMATAMLASSSVLALHHPQTSHSCCCFSFLDVMAYGTAMCPSTSAVTGVGNLQVGQQQRLGMAIIHRNT